MQTDLHLRRSRILCSVKIIIFLKGIIISIEESAFSIEESSIYYQIHIDTLEHLEPDLASSVLRDPPGNPIVHILLLRDITDHLSLSEDFAFKMMDLVFKMMNIV